VEPNSRAGAIVDDVDEETDGSRGRITRAAIEMVPRALVNPLIASFLIGLSVGF